MSFSEQTLIDISPNWVKSVYIHFVRGIKALLKMSGLLNKLDEKAKLDQKYHYWRSLLAIYDVPDLVKLDVPWWTYSAIDFIQKKLESSQEPMSLYEYGSGASTLWLAKRVDRVVSVEHDLKWHNVLRPFLKNFANVDYLLIEPDKQFDENFSSNKMLNTSFKAYVTAIEAYTDKFDIIVIDGRARQACLQIAKRYLKESGMIILDNSNRPEYQTALKQCEMKIKRFPGRVPASPFQGETAILIFP